MAMVNSTAATTELRALSGNDDRTGEELVTWDRSRVPGLKRRLAQRAFKAADLAIRCHAFSAAVNRAALTVTVLGIWHQAPMRFNMRGPSPVIVKLVT